MRNIRAMALAAGLLACLQISAADAQQCQLKLIASLDMIDDPYGRLLIPIDLAGKPHTMLVDTGGYSGSLDVDVADELKLEHKTLSSDNLIYTSNGEKFDHYVTVPSVNIGPVNLENVNFLLEHEGGNIAGTLGPDVLRSFDVDLDFGKRKVNFFSPDHCKGQVVYWARSYVAVPIKITESGHIEITTNLDSHNLDTDFDTGATLSTLSLPIARRIFDVDETSANVTKISGSNPNPVYRTSFKNLSLQGLSIPNPSLNLIPDAMYERAKRDIPDRDRNLPGALPHMTELLLGMDVIHQLHVYIAYQEHMLYVTGADAH